MVVLWRAELFFKQKLNTKYQSTHQPIQNKYLRLNSNVKDNFIVIKNKKILVLFNETQRSAPNYTYFNKNNHGLLTNKIYKNNKIQYIINIILRYYSYVLTLQSIKLQYILKS